VLAHDDLRTVNTAAAPDRVVPKPQPGTAIDDGTLKSRLPARSYHMIRVAI